MILIVKQNLENIRNKTWKLQPSQGQYCFGASRLADLISLDPQSPGIEGLFQFRDNSWWYISMTESTFHSKSGLCSTKLVDGEVIKLGSSTLSISIIDDRANLIDSITRNTYEEGTTPVDLVIIKKNGRIISTKVLGKNDEISNEWNNPVYEVIRKTVNTQDTALFTKTAMSDFVDKDIKKQVGIFGGVIGAIALLAIFGPKNTPQMTKAPDKTRHSIVIRTETKPKEKAPDKAVKTVVANNTTSQASNKVKSFTGGRISQLLGKVSAQAAKSSNIFVGQGISADKGGSGRAMASIGKINRGGTDFGTGTGTGVTISTSGRGGGRNVSGMGGLAAGSTGAGGVGLIEEESEISGGLDREVIAQYIKSQLGTILYCYERQLSAQPDLFGKVAVRFTIGPNGGIEARSIGDSTLKNTNVEGCILQKVSAWKFPNPQGGTRVMVTYPFLFKSTN